jgi:hypothetical protein
LLVETIYNIVSSPDFKQQIINQNVFIDKSVSNLTNYYLKDEINSTFYTKDYINTNYLTKAHIETYYYTKAYITDNYLNKDTIDINYYNKKRIDETFNSYYKKGEIDGISVNLSDEIKLTAGNLSNEINLVSSSLSDEISLVSTSLSDEINLVSSSISDISGQLFPTLQTPNSIFYTDSTRTIKKFTISRKFICFSF